MRAAFHMPKGFLHLVEFEYAVDNRPQFVCLDGPVHFLKHAFRTDEYSLKPDSFHKYRNGIEPGTARKRSNQGYVAADPDRLDRPRQSRGAADLDHVIDSCLIGAFQDRRVPIFASLIVD